MTDPFTVIAHRLRAIQRQSSGAMEAKLGEVTALLLELGLLDGNITARFNKLMDRQRDGVTSTRAMLEKAAVNDPKLREFLHRNPVMTLVQSTTVYSTPETTTFDHPETFGDRLGLQTDVTSFYQRAHRILVILNEVPAFKGTRCVEVTNVRNHLIEHPDKKDGRGKWSFGYGTAVGPQVAPVTYDDEVRKHKDEGYFPNRVKFLHALTKATDKAELSAP